MANLFYNVPIETLLVWLDAAREDLAAGSTQTAWGAADSSAQRQVNLTPQRRIELIWAELNRQDPDTYPLDAIARNSISAVRFNDVSSW